VQYLILTNMQPLYLESLFPLMGSSEMSDPGQFLVEVKKYRTST